MRASLLLSAVSALMASLLGCTKPDPSPTPTSASTTTATATASAPATGATATATTAATATTTATASATATASVPPPPATADAAAQACGSKGLPDCPMQKWMKANTAAASESGDLPALATALDKIVAMAPPGYTNWVSISKDGAAAARAGDLDATRASCTGCHRQYKKQYKADLRARPLPPLPSP